MITAYPARLINVFVNADYIGTSTLKMLADELGVSLDDLTASDEKEYSCVHAAALKIRKKVSGGGLDNLIETGESVPLAVGDEVSWQTPVSIY